MQKLLLGVFIHDRCCNSRPITFHDHNTEVNITVCKNIFVYYKNILEVEKHKQ